MNKELLLKVKKHILEKPGRLRMSRWIASTSDSVGIVVEKKKNGKEAFVFAYDTDWNEPSTQSVPACGTVGCIAGWAVMLHDGVQPSRRYDILPRAKEYLDIPGSELFYPTEWPNQYYEAYLAARTFRQRAKVVGQVIDEFIQKDGVFMYSKWK